jgi:hypothetical protein
VVTKLWGSHGRDRMEKVQLDVFFHKGYNWVFFSIRGKIGYFLPQGVQVGIFSIRGEIGYFLPQGVQLGIFSISGRKYPILPLMEKNTQLYPLWKKTSN